MEVAAGGRAKPWVEAAGVVALDSSEDTLRKVIERLADAPAAASAESLGALAAFKHALARVADDPTYLVEAYQHSTDALVHRSAYLPALFNRALTASSLGLHHHAQEEWNRYIAVDGDSPWADEARERLAVLKRPSIYGTDELFESAFGGLLAKALSDAEALRSLVMIGEKLALETGDQSVAAMAAEIQSATDRGHLDAIRALVAGRAAFNHAAFDQARTALEHAAKTLAFRKSMLEPWCDIWLAGLEIYEGRFDRAVERLAPIRALRAERSHRLLGRANWTSGLALLRAGRLQAAHDHFLESERAFTRGSYGVATASVRALRAQALARMGLERASWLHRIRAIQELQGSKATLPLQNALLEGAWVANRRAPALADAMLQEASQIAASEGDTIGIIEVLLRKGSLLRQRGQHRAASLTFRDAFFKSRSTPLDPIIRERLENRARFGLWSQPGGVENPSLGQLSDAVAYFRRQGPAWRHLTALQAVASQARRRGERDLARTTVRAAISVIRTIQDDLAPSGAAAAAYLESAQAVFDQAITDELVQESPVRALRLLEEARLTGWPATNEQITLPELFLEDRGLRPTDPSRPVVVAFAILEDRIVWWRIDGGHLDFGMAARGEVESLVRTVISQARNGIADLALFEAAYQSLLGDALAGIAPTRPLVVVPDRFLQRLPFAVLRRPGANQSLIEERPISLATSVSAALREKRGNTRTDRHQWRALLVGDPEFDGRELLLDRLPGARHEVSIIKSLYADRAQVLIGIEATAENVREAICESDVVHLAAHALTADDPTEDVLVLAADPKTGSSGLTDPRSLLASCEAPSLVVLSACHSAGHAPSRIGSLLGLARVFIDQGADATIGVLWPADDRVLAGVTPEIHRGLLEGLSAAEALRQAQVAFLANHPDACCDWAALQVVGDLEPDQHTRGTS